MKTRELGKNGFDVSEVGLGTWQIGADWRKDLLSEKVLDIRLGTRRARILFVA